MNIHVPGLGTHAAEAPAVQVQPDLSAAAWRAGLPVLLGKRVTLRELRVSDASNLYSALTTPESSRFMWAPPANVVAFERFIEWTHSERAAGKYICYGVVPAGEDDAWGVFELRQLQPGFFRGELGFVVAPRFWGTGVFLESAELLLDFAFRVVNVHRIEARAAVNNDRGNAALRKLGAKQEGTLEAAFWQQDHLVDQYLWAILATNWLNRKP